MVVQRRQHVEMVGFRTFRSGLISKSVLDIFRNLLADLPRIVVGALHPHGYGPGYNPGDNE
jgi:hypothetical protein